MPIVGVVLETDETELSVVEEAIRGRGLSKRYGAVLAVDGVDLTVHVGRVHGLIGPNGAGKTTVLAMLFGLVEPDEGELRILGRDRAAVERGWLDEVAGFIGSPQFYPYLSGRHNLEYLARLDGNNDGTRIGEVLEAAGLAGTAAEEKVRGYSLGMRQRLGVAAALLRSPRLLILDEPANGLDPAGARDLQVLLRDLAAAGTAVLLSSHDMVAMEGVCDAITVLRAGRTVFDGSLAEMRAAAPSASHVLHTSDDAGAAAQGRITSGVALEELPGGGLALQATGEDLDQFVIDLGREGIAVRNLRLEVGRLESLYFQLIEGGAPRSRFSESPVVPVLSGSRR